MRGLFVAALDAFRVRLEPAEYVLAVALSARPGGCREPDLDGEFFQMCGKMVGGIVPWYMAPKETGTIAAIVALGAGNEGISATVKGALGSLDRRNYIGRSEEQGVTVLRFVDAPVVLGLPVF